MTSPRPTSPISAEQVRAQLAAILRSEVFASARRAQRFLEFVVEQTLAAQQDYIKESVIGTEVFGREPGYDPRADAIVRVEATKLRSRLSDYYAKTGNADDVLIEIPKGSYVPRFSLRESGAKPSLPHTRFKTPAVVGAALAVLAIFAIAATLWIRYPDVAGTPAAVPKPIAVAVLPFLNLSSDPENEYFSDGLTEQLTDILTQVEGLRVASRTSAFTFKGKSADAVEIGSKLHVDAIVEGSVRRSGDELRITAQLIQTSDGYHRWSKTFERSLKDVFELEEEISRQIAQELRVTFAQDAKRRYFSRYTKDIEAFDLYLLGRHLLSSFDPHDVRRAIPLFERALQRDPQFAMAHVGIATAARQDEFTESRAPGEILSQMRTAATRAIEIDPSLAEAYTILGEIAGRFDWNWSEAEKIYRRAIQLNPNAPETRFSYALSLLLPLRRFDEAHAECKKAVELDPITTQWTLCTPWILIVQDPDRAIDEYKRLLTIYPNHPGLLGGLSIAYLNSGHDREAIEIMERTHAEGVPSRAGSLAYAYARTGRMQDTLRIEHQIKERTGYVSPGTLSIIYLGTGRMPEARQKAIELIQERNGNAYLMSVFPIYEPLRRDPEFAAQLKMIGLPF